MTRSTSPGAAARDTNYGRNAVLSAGGVIGGDKVSEGGQQAHDGEAADRGHSLSGDPGRTIVGDGQGAPLHPERCLSLGARFTGALAASAGCTW
ncbi:hypothetical protein [Streptomyces sp. NPDC008001]|uniref:hypothetical protein n=1 Tax=Streptomyces sp. NPDC008001 TaxID=3364804 RepID=UPI0036E39458